MSEILQYYYPEGPYGPICDYVAPDTTKRCRIDADCPPGYVCLNGVCVPRSATIAPSDVEVLFDPPDNDYAYWPKVTCKKDPETGELYDCQPSWDKPFPEDATVGNPTAAWDSSLLDDFGINDSFFVVEIGPQSCQPYDSDINIRPITFVDGNGVKIVKRAYEKSSPVTYPVDASYQVTTEISNSITVKFNDDGTKLVVSGRGYGTVSIKVSWDDDPNTNGVAFDQIGINGITWTRSGQTGSQTKTVSVEAGQSYDVVYVNLNSVNNPVNVVNNGKKLELKDGGGDDANATVSIEDIYSPIQNDTSKGSLWSDVADTYGVWVNPKECTLPCLEQEITYLINFPETDTYYFQCGADNSAEIFLDDETIPFASPTTPTMHNPSIFPGATDPVTISRLITAGNHKVVVRCTNGAGVGSSEESLYIDSSVDWGTITIGSGTAIRDSEDGIPPDDTNSGLNELGGFAVPPDSPSEKYLSFGTLDPTSTPVYTRTASITLDLTDVSVLVFSVIAGTDANGGERPNDVSDTWDISLDGGSTWIQVAPSKQYSGMEFAEYDATYGDWYDFSVNVAETYRVNNATINFRSGGDVPEIGTNYDGLTPTQVETTYANCGDVFGLYRIKKITFQRGTCNTIHPNAYDWSKNPGGWFIKICQSAPCQVSQTIDWYPVTLGSPWVSLMNDYAVWPSQTEALADTTHTATYFVSIINSDTYTLKYAGDNEIEIYWDGLQVAQLTGDVSPHYTTIHSVNILNVSSGQHTLVMKLNNISNSSSTGQWSDNPAGGAWTLEDSNGNIVKTSRDLITSGDGNLIWHTRLATGYRYEES